MNIAMARKILEGPLVFGNEKQIEASNLLAAWEEARDLDFEGHACEECDGEGEVDCECRSCGDTHYRKCPTCDGTGIDAPELDKLDLNGLLKYIEETRAELAS